MTRNINIKMPDKVKKIVGILYRSNHEAFIVGGCVRDSILGIKPKDWDITTSAEPEEIIELFNSEGCTTVPTGIKHGTITVVIEKEPFEITTYRIDGEYKDSRHPSEVKFTKSLEEDLKRRDYTINAMAYNDKVGLVDYFNGQEDIDKKLIRAVGEPKKRLEEDALRMLRAHRFSAQLGFKIEKETSEAIKALSVNIRQVSIERIREEFNKILLSNNLVQLFQLYENGLLQHFFGELANCFERSKKKGDISIYSHVYLIELLQSIEKELSLRWAILINYINEFSYNIEDTLVKPNQCKYSTTSQDCASNILKRMKYDNKTIERVLVLAKYQEVTISDKVAIKRILNTTGIENFKALVEIKEAKIKLQSENDINEGMKEIVRIKEEFYEIISSNQCFTIKDLAVKGEDIIKLGVKPGKFIGEILNTLLDMVINEPEINEKHILIGKVKEQMDTREI